MKKIILTFCVVFISYLQSASAWIIYQRTTANGGPNGYKDITELRTYLGTIENVCMIHCEGPGDKKCPKKVQNQMYDDWTSNVLNQLLENVFVNLNQGNLVGVEHHTYQDPQTGERFVFTISWNHTDLETGSITVDKSPCSL